MNLASWKAKIDSESAQICADGDTYVDGDSDDQATKNEVTDHDTSPYQGGCFQDNNLTIGFVGEFYIISNITWKYIRHFSLSDKKNDKM